MSHTQLNLLMKEIEMNKKELLEISNQTRSLIHHRVIEKSHKLDSLITQYHKLISRR